jgi:Na+/melibiose symporter-like transporter
VADLVGKRWRTPAMGVLFAFSSIGFASGPMFEIYLPSQNISKHAMYVTCVGVCVALSLWILCFMKETNPNILLKRNGAVDAARASDLRGSGGAGGSAGERVEGRNDGMVLLPSSSSSQSEEQDDDMACGSCGHNSFMTGGRLHRLNPCRSVRLMFRNPLMQVVGVVTLLSNISESGVIELFLIYLRDVVNFTAYDNAYLLLVLCVASCYTQTIVMRWFLVLSSETTMILFGLSANACHLMLYVLVGSTQQKWATLLIDTFSSLTFLPLSAFSSIVSKQSDRRDRGMYLGTLMSLRSLSSVIGPMCFTPL